MQVTVLDHKVTFVAVLILSCIAHAALPSEGSGLLDPSNQPELLSSDAYMFTSASLEVSVEPSLDFSTSSTSSSSSSSETSATPTSSTAATSFSSSTTPTFSLVPTPTDEPTAIPSMPTTPTSGEPVLPTESTMPTTPTSGKPVFPTESTMPTSPGDTATTPAKSNTEPHPSAVKTTTGKPTKTQSAAVMPSCPPTQVPIGDCSCQKTLGLSLGISIPCSAIVAVLITSLFFIYCQKAAKKKNSYVRMAPTVYFDEEEEQD